MNGEGTMPEVKEAFGQLLAGQPPMTPVNAAIQAGRRAERRRRTVRLAGGAGALAVAAVAAVTAATTLAGGPAPVGPAQQSPIPTEHPAATASIRPLTGAQALDVIARGLPSGYTIRKSPSGDDVLVHDIDDPAGLKGDPKLAGLWSHNAAALVYFGNSAGEIVVDLDASRQAPPSGDLCTTTTLYGDQETSCRTLSVGSVDPVRLRVGTAVLDGARCEFATRYLTDGRVTVTQCLTRRVLRHLSGAGLDQQVFGTTRLAEVAADPAFARAALPGS